MLTLDAVSTLIVDCEHKTAPKSESGFPLIRTPDIGKGRLSHKSAQRVDEETYRTWTQRAIPVPGDLILAREAPVGNVGIVTENMNPCLGQRTVLIRPNPELADPHFLNYLLNSPEMQGAMIALANGATVAHLNMKDIRKLALPDLPDIEVQGIVGRLLSSYDELIENNSRRIEILEEMAQAIYREWFVEYRYPGHEDVPLVDSELGPIPEDWAVSDLGSVCTRVQAGGTPSRKNPEFWDDGVINWFRTTELQDGFLFDSSEKISQAGLEGSSAKMFQAGSILMAIYGSPTVGRLGILTRDATCNQAALALVPDESVLSHPFLYQTLTSLREHFNSIAQGAAQQNISKATVAGTLMMLPPRPLVDLYDQLAVPIWDLTRTLTEQLGNLRETRDLLLPRLISGEIDVSELDIELAGLSV